MPFFSNISKQRLESAHPDLQRLFNEVIKHWDCTIVCGFRNEQDQNIAYENGFSNVKWPNGRHNKYPSDAVDVAPYDKRINGINWKDIERFKQFGFFVLGVAAGMGIKITWGADWNMDYEIDEKKFIDLPHYQRVL